MIADLPLDDLEAYARASWQVAGEICSCDGDYHRAHPLLRVIGLRPGISADRETMNELLPGLLAPGSRILIAGAADATLVRYFIENSNVRPLSITVVDLCPAPLRLIDRLILPAGITVETKQVDLTTWDEQGGYDLILSHSMLTFVSHRLRLEILRRLGANLKPEGRLMLVGRVSKILPKPEDYVDMWMERVVGELAAFPDLVDFCGRDLMTALRSNAVLSYDRPRYGSSTDMNDLLDQAGLKIVREVLSGDVHDFATLNAGLRERTGHIFLAARSESDCRADENIRRRGNRVRQSS